MLSIENYISPFIQSQFPSFYMEDGPNFVAFIEAYYEWLENNYQLVTVASNTGFTAGDAVQQTSQTSDFVTGTIVSIEGNNLLIKLPEYQAFIPSAQFTNNDHLVLSSNTSVQSSIDDVQLITPVFQARNIFKSRDIDTTLDQFILHFKEKYLKNINFNTATNKKLLVKNSLDLYRAKGTEKAVDLFFRLVYGTEARVYYPGQDMLRVSDGTWTVPSYIEITDSPITVNYVGKQITGAVSRATAFVERYIKRRVSGSVVCVLYVSNINGTFLVDEPLQTDAYIAGTLSYESQYYLTVDSSDPFSVGTSVYQGPSNTSTTATAVINQIPDTSTLVVSLTSGTIVGDSTTNITSSSNNLATALVTSSVVYPTAVTVDNPRIVGSLTNVDLIIGGNEFNVGDLVNIGISTSTGESAVGRVANTANTTGIVEFQLVDGGWGYTTSAQTIVSEKVLTLNNVRTSNSSSYYRYFDTLVQPTASIVYQDGNSVFAVDETLYYWSDPSTIAARGVVYQNTVANSSVGYANGTLLISLNIGNTIPAGANLVNSGNTKFAKVTSFTDTSAQATIMGIPNTAIVTIASTDTRFAKGATITQGNSSQVWATGYCNTVSTSGGNTIILVSNTYGAFRPNVNAVVTGTTATGNVRNIQITAGVYNIIGAFNTGNLYTRSTFGGTTGYVIGSSSGYGASFGVGNIGDTEQVFLNTDLLNGNNGLITSSNAYVDFGRKLLTVDTTTGFTNSSVVYQEIQTIGFAPTTAVNASTGFINVLNANSYYFAGDYVQYKALGSNSINELANSATVYISQSNSTGVTLARNYDYVVYNTTNFPNYANNLSSLGSLHFLTKLAYGNAVVVNTSAATITVRGSQNQWGSTPSYTANATQYANSKIYAYNYTVSSDGLQQVTVSDPTVSANIVSVGTSASVNVAVRVNRTTKFNDFAYGLPKSPYGSLNDTIYSMLGYQLFTLGTIGTLTNINPGNTYNVDPYVLVNQPYISNYGRHDYRMVVANATTSFTVGEKITQTPTVYTTYSLSVGNSTLFTVGDRVYQGTKAAPTATASVVDIPSSTNMIVGTVTGTLTGNSTAAVNLYSYGAGYVLRTSNSTFFATGEKVYQGTLVSPTATGIVTSVNTTAISVGSVTGTFTGNSTVTSSTYSYMSQYVLTVANSNPFSIGTAVFQGPNSSATTANAVIMQIPNSTIIVVGSVTGTITGNSTVNVTSFANTLVTTAATNSVAFPASVTNAVSLYGTTVTGNSTITNYITAQGIVKSSALNTDGTTTIEVKRINFNNTWQVGQQITGVYSGSSGNIVSVGEITTLANNIIGLNAQVSANVVVANGQVTALDIYDSGFGYVENDVVEFVSQDGSRAGSVKIHTGGIGRGSGYYNSSKGFLSDDKYIQDSDYYQEYSYEIISKLPFDQYSEMYNQVMHMAGTRLFGSVELVEHNQLPAANLKSIQTNQQIGFNSQSDVNGTNETIYVGLKKDLRTFNSSLISDNFIPIDNTTSNPYNENPFVVGDQIQYYNTSGAAVTGLSNSSFYYVSFANTSGIALTSTLNGSNISLSPIGSATHYIQSYQRTFSNGDLATYSFDSSNTALVANVQIPFSIRTGIGNGFIKSAIVPRDGTKLTYVPSNYDHAVSGITIAMNANTGVRTSGVVRPSNNIFRTGDTVLYYTASGNSAIPGLTNATAYYVANSVGSNVTLSKSSTLVYTSVSNTNVLANGQFNIPAANAAPMSIAFKPDGTRMYIGPNASGKTGQIQEYTLTTPWQVNTAVFAGNSSNWYSSTGPLTFGPGGIAFKSDGTAMYVSLVYSDKVAQFSLSTPWSVNSASFAQALDTRPTANTLTFANSALDVVADFITYAGANSIFANSAQVIIATATVGGTIPAGLSNNNLLYIRYANSSGFALSTSTTAANVNFTTAGTGSFKVKQSITQLLDIKFNNDGTKMYISRGSSIIDEYILSTPWDISTATLNTSKTLSTGGSPQGFTFTADGKKLFTVAASGVGISNSIYSYNLSTPWDISTTVYDNQRKILPIVNSYAIDLKPDASRFFVADITANSVTEYDWRPTYPSQNVEAGHYLLKTEFTTTNSNTSGFRLAANNGTLLSFKSSSYVETHNLVATTLQSGLSYYVVNSTPTRVQLALMANGTAINITANSTASGQATSGHYLEKVVEE